MYVAFLTLLIINVLMFKGTGITTDKNHLDELLKKSSVIVNQ